jgi:hypothetical protein
MEESTTYRWILSQGEKKVLLRMGTKKFGPPDTATLATLEKIEDLGRLEQMAERLLDASSWQELLASPN